MPAWIVPAAIAAGQIVAGLIGQNKQNKAQKALAQHQASMNERYLQQQLEYNSPKMQMARYLDAGLNPHLIYSQGNPGNQAAPLSAPQQEVSKYGALGSSLAQLGPLANQTAMVNSQTQAIDAKTRQTYVLTQLNALQAELIKKNPLLDEAGFNAIIQGLVSSAEIKAADSSVKKEQAAWFTGEKSFKINGVEMHGPAGVLKMETELKLLEQKYNLGTADAQIKAEVVRSKGFQNDLLEIQTKWMKDAEITPQHILQFIQLLILKFF